MATALPALHILRADELRIGEAVVALDGQALIGKHVWYMGGRWTETSEGIHKHNIVGLTDFRTFQDRLFNPEDYRLVPVPIHSDEIDDPHREHETAVTELAIPSHKISKAHRALKMIGQEDFDDVKAGVAHLAFRTCCQFLYPGKVVEIEDKHGLRADNILAIGVGLKGPLAVTTLSEPDLWVDLRDVTLTFEDKLQPKRTTVTVDRLQSVVPN